MPSRPSTLAPTLPEDHGAESALHVIGQAAAFRARPPQPRDVMTRVRHDLCSLVHAVIGYSDLLAEPAYGSLTPEQARFVTHVRSAAEQLQELVETTIELSRPDNDQFSLQSPESRVGQLLRRVRGTLAERGMLCDLTLAACIELRLVRVDVEQLQRALLGLAQVFTRGSSARVSLRAALEDGHLALSLRASDALDPTDPGQDLTQLENLVGNRDFIRLTLSERLIARADGVLLVSRTLDAAHLTFPLHG